MRIHCSRKAVTSTLREVADLTVTGMGKAGYRLGFPFACANALGAATATMISYSIAFPGAAGYVLGFLMSSKTAFVNILIGYALFKKSNAPITSAVFAEEKGPFSEHVALVSSNAKVHTSSTDVLFTLIILSALTDLLTNFIATKTTFESLGNTLTEKRGLDADPMFFTAIGVIFAIFACLQSIFQTTKFMFNIWERSLHSDPRDRFQRWVSSFTCFKPCKNKFCNENYPHALSPRSDSSQGGPASSPFQKV